MQKQIIPRCEKCKKLYSVSVYDGTEFCLKCRTNEGGNEHGSTKGAQLMNDNNDNQVQVELALNENKVEGESTQSTETQAVVSEETTAQNEIKQSGELKIEDIVQPGKHGVTNRQLIPSIQNAIAEKSLEKLILIKSSYLYTFENSIRYLKKSEREYIAANLK